MLVLALNSDVSLIQRETYLNTMFAWLNPVNSAGYSSFLSEEITESMVTFNAQTICAS